MSVGPQHHHHPTETFSHHRSRRRSFSHRQPTSTMSISLSPSPSPHLSLPSSHHPHACLTLLPPPMSVLCRLASSSPLRSQLHHSRRFPRRFFSVVSEAVRKDTAAWTQAPVSVIEPAADSLFHIAIDVSADPDLAASYTRAGQYLQLRVPDAQKPSFLAIASPPSHAVVRGQFEFLVKSVAGSPAELLCGLKKGDVVEVSAVMGNGFDIGRISPPEEFNTVLIFATGSGISPIRSLIESGFGAEKRSDVRLFYGARNLQKMAYQERFKVWESSGVKIVPVLSQSDGKWAGETGYVQAAFSKIRSISSPSSTGAVLCGQKQMIEEVTALLVEDGVSTEKILKNF